MSNRANPIMLSAGIDVGSSSIKVAIVEDPGNGEPRVLGTRVKRRLAPNLTVCSFLCQVKALTKLWSGVCRVDVKVMGSNMSMNRSVT